MARLTAPPQVKLKIQQWNDEIFINWGISPIERFLALNEEGINRIAADRKLETRVSKNKISLSNEEINAGYATMR